MTLTLSRAHAIVLYDWLMTADLGAIPITHKAEEQALVDLLAIIEHDADIPFGPSGKDLNEEELAAARAELLTEMG